MFAHGLETDLSQEPTERGELASPRAAGTYCFSNGISAIFLMTFLNPIVLFGLVAAAIPIIIHLLNLRKLRTVEFSSLKFLKELQKTKMRRIRIRQLLLLLLRTLIVIAMVFAFSRPALRGSLAGIAGGHATTTMVILLDDSPSMTVRNERGVLFNQAKEAADRLVNLAKDGDHLFLLRLSETRRAASFAPLRSISAARAALTPAEPGDVSVPYREALRAASRITRESPNANEEVYLITDAQATQFRPDTAATDSAEGFEPGAKLFLIRVGESGEGNAGVSSAVVATQINTRNKPIQLRTTVRNAEASPMRGSIMSVYLDGARVVQQSLDIAPFSTLNAEVQFNAKRRGLLKGYVQIEDDALEADNRRHFVVRVPDHLSILLAGGTAADTKLASLALSLAGDTTIADLFSVRLVAEPQLPSMDLNSFDVIVLCNVRSFSAALAERLDSYVRAGGGLMLFPGSQADLRNYNEVLFARMGIPPATPPPLLPAGTAALDQRSFLSFEKTDLAHPLFAGLFEQPAGRRRDTRVESPRVYAAIGARAGRNGNAIISLSDGNPFLTEYTIGNGRALLCSVEAGMTWSDFPTTGLFAPLLYRSMIYLAATNQTVPSITVGEPMQFPVRLKNYGERDVYLLRSPSGVDEKVAPKILPASSTALFETKRTDQAGIYELRRSSAEMTQGGAESKIPPLQAVAVNVDPLETDLHPVNSEQLEQFWASAGIQPDAVTELEGTQAVDKAVEQSRYGVELWKHFLGLALILALIEMAVGREPKGADRQDEGT